MVDSPVHGAGYFTSSGHLGLTAQNGVFMYRQGDEVTFRVGQLVLGSAPGGGVVTLPDLVDGARAAMASGASVDEVMDSYPAIVNIARLLQSLDVDGDSSNGIQLPEEAREKAASYVDSIDFSDPQTFADGDQPAVAFLCEVKQQRGAQSCGLEDVVAEDSARAEVKQTEQQREEGEINMLPVVSAGDGMVVAEADEISLQGSAADRDGSIVSVLWQQSDKNGVAIDGSISISDATSLNASFIAPEVEEDRIFYISLTATDDRDASASDVLSVAVINSSAGGNIAPQADAGADQSVDAGDTVSLDAAASSDADGQIVSYHWQQVDASGDAVNDGPALENADTATASFVAPAATEVVQLYFHVSVSDDGGASHGDAVTITVQPDDREPVNNPPFAAAGGDQAKESGDAVTLDGSASSDPDGDPLSYLWQQQEDQSPRVDLMDAETAIASFTAPEVSDSTPLEFILTVSDGELSANDSVIVTVTPPPTICDPTDVGTLPQCRSDCEDSNPDTECKLPVEDLIASP